jgi:hypothetical protein
MKKARLILGMILLPVFAVIYFIDRALLLIMPWIEQSNIKKWFSGTKEMTASFIRVLTLLLCYGVYSLINWFI